MKNPKARNFQMGSVSMVGEITERKLHYRALLIAVALIWLIPDRRIEKVLMP
ncbi:MAG: hypothetical protein ABI606_07935 [Rhodoferax sp.]